MLYLMNSAKERSWYIMNSHWERYVCVFAVHVLALHFYTELLVYAVNMPTVVLFLFLTRYIWKIWILSSCDPYHIFAIYRLQF